MVKNCSVVSGTLSILLIEEFGAQFLSFFFFLFIQYLFVFFLSSPEPTTFPRLPGEVQEKEHPGQRRHGKKNYGRWIRLPHMAKRRRKAASRQKSPMASGRAKPKMA